MPQGVERYPPGDPSDQATCPGSVAPYALSPVLWAPIKGPQRPCKVFNSESGSLRAARQKYHPGVEHYPPGAFTG